MSALLEEVLRMECDAAGFGKVGVFVTPHLGHAQCQRGARAARIERETHLTSNRDHGRAIFHDELEVRICLRQDGTDSAADVDHDLVLRQLVSRVSWKPFSIPARDGSRCTRLAARHGRRSSQALNTAYRSWHVMFEPPQPPLMAFEERVVCQ